MSLTHGLEKRSVSPDANLTHVRSKFLPQAFRHGSALETWQRVLATKARNTKRSIF